MREGCYLCPNMCGVDRKNDIGLCGAGEDISLAFFGKHFFEEPPISGKNGSGTVFFSHCTMRCAYCQNYEISRDAAGRTVSPQELADVFKRLEEDGAHNVNLVTPTQFSVGIRKALDIYRPKIPIVYNTSGYERVEILRELEPYIDIYLTDFKYSDDDLCERLSGRRRYREIALAATEEMVRQKKLSYGDDGMMKTGVIVRHLVLPTYLENTFGVIDIFKESFFDRAVFSVMSQFTPTEGSPIKRPLKPIEYKIILNRLTERGIEEGFIQDLSSVGTEFVPDFKSFLNKN